MLAYGLHKCGMRSTADVLLCRQHWHRMLRCLLWKRGLHVSKCRLASSSSCGAVACLWQCAGIVGSAGLHAGPALHGQP